MQETKKIYRVYDEEIGATNVLVEIVVREDDKTYYVQGGGQLSKSRSDIFTDKRLAYLCAEACIAVREKALATNRRQLMEALLR